MWCVFRRLLTFFPYWLPMSSSTMCFSNYFWNNFFYWYYINRKKSKFRSRKYTAYKMEKCGHSTLPTIITFYKGKDCSMTRCISRGHCFQSLASHSHLCVLSLCKTPLCLASFVMLWSGLFKPLAILVYLSPPQRGYNSIWLFRLPHSETHFFLCQPKLTLYCGSSLRTWITFVTVIFALCVCEIS